MSGPKLLGFWRQAIVIIAVVAAMITPTVDPVNMALVMLSGHVIPPPAGVDTATTEMCGQVIYPAAVLKVSKNVEAAKAFLDFLTSDAADAVFEKVGFTPLK